jgi:hypothetical protein
MDAGCYCLHAARTLAAAAVGRWRGPASASRLEPSMQQQQPLATVEGPEPSVESAAAVLAQGSQARGPRDKGMYGICMYGIPM